MCLLWHLNHFIFISWKQSSLGDGWNESIIRFQHLSYEEQIHAAQVEAQIICLSEYIF